MKKTNLKIDIILFIGIIISLNLGCEQIKDWNLKQKEKKTGERNKFWENRYSKKLKKELESGKKNNNIFLTFKFGDSKTAITKKLAKLEKEGKVSVDANNKYYYEFVFNEFEFNNAKAYFSMKYNKNELYQLNMIIEPNEMWNTLENSSAVLFLSLHNIYKENYGTPIYYRTNPLDHSEVRWINCNQEIKIVQKLHNVTLSYTDKPIEIKLENKKESELKNKIKSKKNDI